MRHKWLNEHHNAGNIKIAHITGDKQKADILTKPLHKSRFELNRGWLLSSLTILAVIFSFFTFCSPIRLKQTQPVYYQSSDIKYMNQLQRFRFKVIIMNPCETYFANITNKKGINDKLIHDCDEAFDKMARLDHCNKRNATSRVTRETNVQTGLLEDAGKFFSGLSKEVTDGLGITIPEKPSRVAPELTPKPTTSTTNAVTQLKSNEIIVREKRIVPAIAVLGLIVVSGIQTYTAYKVDVNVSNIKELAKATNDERKFLENGYAVMKEMREKIHEFNSRISHIEMRLDKIDRTIEQFPKIVALVNSYDNQFRELSENLADIDNESLHNLASPAIFRIARNNTLLESNNDKLLLEECAEEIMYGQKHMAFNYQFLMPQTNPKVRIMKAESFRFWNLTATNKYCWMKYSGPRYILVNTTNSCLKDIQEYWISEKSVRSQPCHNDNQQLEPIQHLYHADICRSDFKNDTKDIQIKQFNGLYRIYCFGSTITINKEKIQCPDYVFELPISEKFELNNEVYDLGEVSTVTVNAVELHINNELAEQLKTDKVKIYGTNTTALDTSFERLSRLTETIMKDVKLIESPISNWLFDSMKGIMSHISSFISGFSTIVTIILAIGAVILLFPVIEIGIILYKFGYRAFSAIASPMQRLMVRLRSKRIRRKNINRVRRYLTGE